MKQKRSYTRRQRALRWLVRLLAVLLICGSVGSICGILPVQTVDTVRRKQGLEKTEVVYSTWVTQPPMTGKRLYLSRNEDVLLLSAAAWERGWYDYAPGLILDPDAPEPYAVWKVGNVEQAWVCIVGFVPEGEKPPTFYVGVARRDSGPMGLDNNYVYVEEPLTVLPEANIPVKGGACYLAACGVSGEGYEADRSVTVAATVKRDGKWVELENWLITSG